VIRLGALDDGRVLDDVARGEVRGVAAEEPHVRQEHEVLSVDARGHEDVRLGGRIREQLGEAPWCVAETKTARAATPLTPSQFLSR
jgi:hypothetical protein